MTIGSRSASSVRISELGDLPEDVLTKCRHNQLETAQDLIDNEQAGCLAIGLSQTDVSVLNEMLRRHDFNEIL